MLARWMIAVIAAAPVACSSHSTRMSEENEPPESGEVKVQLSQTPAPVRATIERELRGGELEDIARIRVNGKTAYETDLIRDGHKYEVIIAYNGEILSNKQEGKADEARADAWQDHFNVKTSSLRPTGANQWLAIKPGTVLKLRDGSDTLIITVLPETTTIDGVTVGILEERESKGGQLIEVSRNFFATDPSTQDVYYFGEDVDNHKNGVVINHDSAWRSGVNGARFGLMVPGKPRVGQKYYQEIAPKVALDRVEIVSTTETLKVPAGTFTNCLHLKETTPLESGSSHKWYAPGIGMIKDDDFELAEMP